LIGKTLKSVSFGDREIVLHLNSNRVIEWFCLSTDELGYRVIDEN